MIDAESRWLDLFRGTNRVRTFTAVMLWVGQQWTGQVGDDSIRMQRLTRSNSSRRTARRSSVRSAERPTRSSTS